MPIYEYRCHECGEKFEKLIRSLASVQEICCPRCGSSRVEKAISLFGTSASSGSTFSSQASCAPTGG